MSDAAAELQALLQRWFDDGERSALDQACALAKSRAVRVDVLLSWLQDEVIAEDGARDLAIRRMRRALGLPMMPGPVCRPLPRSRLP